MFEVAIDKHYIKNHPQINNPNWVQVGNVQQMFVHPIKGGERMPHHSCRCNHNGMIMTGSENRKLWDGMFFLYNQQTEKILHWSNTALLSSISVDMTQQGIKIFRSKLLDNLDALCITDVSLIKNSYIRYYSSWHTGKPIKLIDHGDEAGEWITRCLKFDAPLRLLERCCDPLIEATNFITENWIDYCAIYSTKSDEKPEMFADLTRCVLMTQSTLYTLFRDVTNTYKSYVIRPNILISTLNPIMPFSEEDWEWVKIRNTIIRIMKPVPKYHITKPSSFSEPYSSLKLQYYLFSKEDDTAHLGVYCAPIVSGEIKTNDNVYVYYNPIKALVLNQSPFNYAF